MENNYKQTEDYRNNGNSNGNGNGNDKFYRRRSYLTCLNCNDHGHIAQFCTHPITSFGIIAYKVYTSESQEDLNDTNPEVEEILGHEQIKEYPRIKYLMIQRKDTMGYIDFLRGKYPDSYYLKRSRIKTLFDEMTSTEKHNLLTKPFDLLWNELWLNHNSKCYNNEYENAKRKFEQVHIQECIDMSDNVYSFQEFGFPKGRKNPKESNLGCAKREFREETGYNSEEYILLHNCPEIVEEFIGTNNVRYRHIYYLVEAHHTIRSCRVDNNNILQMGEVRNIAWLDYNQCKSVIRPYDTAKIDILTKLHQYLKNKFTNNSVIE